MKKILLLSAFFFSGSTFAMCDDAQTQNELNVCSFEEYQEADKLLNKTYNSYINTLDPARKKQFKAVQLNWIKYKEADCKYAASTYEGGSIHSLLMNSCLTRKTKLRIDELKTYLEEQNM